MAVTKVSAAIGRGVQLFRVRSPKKHFVELADLPPLRELSVGPRRIWKAKEEDAWYALLTIPYKDEEEILVRGPDSKWEDWNWSDLASQADQCRWKGQNLEERYVL